MKVHSSYIVLLLLLLLSSCEDIIMVDLDQGTSQLNVDAWITTKKEKQTIILKKTAPYFSNEQLEGLSEATVKLSDILGNSWNFEYETNGVYAYTPELTDTFLSIGKTYLLEIKTANSTYNASTILHPTTMIDSIGVEEREASGPNAKGMYAVLYALDLKGRSDYYWIKTYRNNLYIDDPLSINIAADAAFPPNGAADGFLFIPPIRYGITPFNKPFKIGENIRVEIHSITEVTYSFISEAKTQITNEGLFAKPPSNVPTNIINITNPDEKAVGWFSVSAVSSMEKEIKQ
jgi:hypothetical protein